MGRTYYDYILPLSRAARKRTWLYRIFQWMYECIMTLFRLLPDTIFAKTQYYIHNRKRLNLRNPRTFNEKLWAMKLCDRDPLKTICADKYRVREYIHDKGLDDLLPVLLCTYEYPEEIDFSVFKHEVMLKCNHSSGVNCIYDPDTVFDYRGFLKTFKRAMKSNYYNYSREWPYKNIAPRIIVEDVIRDQNGQLPMDYKFMCFQGEPKLMLYEANVCAADGLHSVSDNRFVNVYDMHFKYVPVRLSRVPPKPDAHITCPESFERMKEIAARLSTPFAFCRVDLYDVDGHVYFGELTFYHGGANVAVSPDEWSFRMGDWLKAPMHNS